MVQSPATAKVSVAEAEVTKPLKKRRKNQAGSGDERMELDWPPTPEQAPHLDTEQKEVAPLRSFPVPKQPELPSKFALARQGVGHPLANAEVIDPQTTLSLQEENHVTRRLSARVRKRLGELGITKLFASKLLCLSAGVITDLVLPVQTAILPLLLTNSSTESDIYGRYDIPRDVLASAPTGSGKTLAYVIPIVEARRMISKLFEILTKFLSSDTHLTYCHSSSRVSGATYPRSRPAS